MSAPASAPVLEPDVTARVSGPADTVLFVSAARSKMGLAERLVRAGRTVIRAADITTALQRLAEGRVDLCLVDLTDERSAIPLIRMVRAQHPTVPVVALADASNPTAVAEALYSGAADLLPWPAEERELLTVLDNAGDRAGQVLPDSGGLRGRVFSQSPAMRHAMEQLQAAAAGRGPVTISGEPATGRGLLARTLHEAGGGAPIGSPAPFVVVDCAGAGPQELERSLFGVVTERDTGGGEPEAIERLGRSGAVVEALGGTLVLRRLSEAPARVQARLARLLRDREARLGGRRQVVELDLRAVAVVEPGVDAQVEDGRLRQDLFDRFAARRIDVPPLRRRREDVPLLAACILGDLGRAIPGGPRSLSRSAMVLLAAMPWRGNVTELRELLATLARSTRRPVIQLEHILEHARLDGLSGAIDPGVTLKDAKARFERDCISTVLLRHHGRVGEAAKALGIQRTNLYRKVRQLNVARSLLSRK